MKLVHNIFLLYLLTGFPVRGQDSYLSVFGRDTTRWHYLTDYAVADLLHTVPYKAYGDTLVQEIHYRKLSENLWDSGDQAAGLIREDSIYGGVWVRFFGDTSDFLVMDLRGNRDHSYFQGHRSWSVQRTALCL